MCEYSRCFLWAVVALAVEQSRHFWVECLLAFPAGTWWFGDHFVVAFDDADDADVLALKDIWNFILLGRWQPIINYYACCL